MLFVGKGNIVARIARLKTLALEHTSRIWATNKLHGRKCDSAPNNNCREIAAPFIEMTLLRVLVLTYFHGQKLDAPTQVDDRK